VAALAACVSPACCVKKLALRRLGAVDGGWLGSVCPVDGFRGVVEAENRGQGRDI